MPALKSVVPSLTMWKWKVPRITGRSALGALSTKVTSLGPVAFTLSIWSASTLALEAVAGSLWRITENTTSAGDSALPSWNGDALAQREHPGLGILGGERFGQRGLRRQAAVQRSSGRCRSCCSASSRSGSTAWPDRACRWRRRWRLPRGCGRRCRGVCAWAAHRHACEAAGQRGLHAAGHQHRRGCRAAWRRACSDCHHAKAFVGTDEVLEALVAGARSWWVLLRGRGVEEIGNERKR